MSIKIILSTREIFSDVAPMYDTLKAMDLLPEMVLSYLLAQWFTIHSEESPIYMYYDFNQMDMLEVYCVEDLLLHRNVPSDSVRDGIATIKHITRRFYLEMVPTIESFDLHPKQFQGARVEWLGASVVIDIKE